MNLLMGLSKISDNLDELERRMRDLENLNATVGNTKGNQPHPNFDGSYNDLFWLQHSGSTKARIPPRPIASIASMSYKGDDLLKKGLQQYFSNIDKKGKMSAEQALKPWLKGFYDYSLSIFGNTTMLKSNAQFTIDKKGFNQPLIETGALKEAWGVMIEGTRVEL
ncbi:coil containing protein [Vibrio phage 1.161.O._10N.261.48.C5]|nr:coil containing protein [Vibrio phage 1.161.O._10N.261.48.C5]